MSDEAETEEEKATRILRETHRDAHPTSIQLFLFLVVRHEQAS